MATLVGLGASYYQDSTSEARQTLVKYNLKAVRDAISRYFKDNMRYPADFSSLEGAYLTQSVQELLLSPAAGSVELLVEIRDSVKTAETNIFHIPVENCKWITYDFTGTGSGNEQMRSIKVKYDGLIMDW